MRKAWCLIIAAAILTSGASFAFAEETTTEPSAEATVVEAVEEAAEDPMADLLASVKGITFEYDKSASTELVRVVKVRYDKSYFTSGINGFNVKISVPSAYVASVSYSSKLSGFNITDAYSGGVYTCSGSNTKDAIPSDGLLFTMKITLKNNILQPFTIALTGDTSISDASGISQSLTNGGLAGASLEIPANINDVGDSGTDGAVTWKYANEELTLSGNGTMKDYGEGDAPWYKYADKIKTIRFNEDKLENIGKNAFYGLTKATEVILSADIHTINDYAFAGCSSIRNIDIPTNSGVGIGDYAFKDCSSLTSLVIPNGVTTIGNGAFAGCTGLNSVTLPFIGSQSSSGNSKNTFSYIFAGDVPSSIKTVSITNEVAVPESAFEGCASIQNIYLNNSITAIGANAFKGCRQLKEFSIPSGVTELPDSVFEGCSSLTGVSNMAGIASIGTAAFSDCSSLQEIDIPTAVTVINDNTFKNCSSLQEIVIPADVTQIGTNVLAGCTKLVEIKIPFVGANEDPGSTAETEEGIFGYLFGGANSSVPAGVTKVEVTGSQGGYIPKAAFKGCSNIVDITIDQTRDVLDGAFANCKLLQTLYLPQRVSSIGAKICEGCTKLQTLTVPFIGTSRSDSGKETSVLGGFFGYDDSDVRGTEQYYDSNSSHYYKIPRTLKNVSVLNHTSIPTGAFMECDFIENISIVTGAKMGERVFYDCRSLKTLSLPNDLTDIGEQAFAECENLETVNVPTKVKTIGDNAFYNDRNLKVVTMPDSITTIADTVFNGTGLYDEEVQLMSGGVIKCTKGSAADEFAQRKGIATQYVSAAELDIKNMGATITEQSTGSYKVEAINTNQLSGDLYIAIYDKNGKMLAVHKDTLTSTDAEKHFEFTKEESNGVSYAKIFVWNGKMKSAATEAAKATL